MASKLTAMRRRRSRSNAKLTIRNPVPTPDSCEQCRLAHRRVRFSISLEETGRVVTALGNDPANAELAAYFNAHLTIALRRDSYEYDN